MSRPAASPYGGMPRAGGTPVGGHSSGGYPAMHGQSGGGDNRNLWIALGTIAAVALIVIIVVMATSASGSEEGYTDETESDFMAECGGGEDCECAYDLIVERISYDRFTELEAELQDDPSAQPAELVEIKEDCGIA